jgi:hypothetical protein
MLDDGFERHRHLSEIKDSMISRGATSVMLQELCKMAMNASIQGG